jgi:hypothetical protein
MSRRVATNFGLGIFAGGLCLVLTLSAPAAQTAFQQKQLTDYLKEHEWVPLSIPDSKMRPGSVVKVTKKNDFTEVRWLGDIRKCGITDKQLGIVKGKYPVIGLGDTFAVKASFAASVLSFVGINIGADKVSGATLKIEDGGGDAIDLLAFSLWMNKQGKRLQTACGNLLAQEDVFIVSEAFRISKGSYQMFDKFGGKIALSASVPGRSAEGQLDASIGKNGEISIAGDSYAGIRRIKQLSPGTFATLGTSKEIPEADQLLLREAQ